MLFAISPDFTRPADTTAYTVGDLVANNTTPANVVPLDFMTAGTFLDTRSGWLRRAMVTVRGAGVSITNGSFNLDVFRYRPAVTNGDNGVYAPLSGASQIGPGWIARLSGALVVNTANEAYGSLQPGGANNQFDIPIRLDRPASNVRGLADDGLFGLLSAAGAWTPPSAAVFAVRLEFDTPAY
jgi:hypothetical protein